MTKKNTGERGVHIDDLLQLVIFRPHCVKPNFKYHHFFHSWCVNRKLAVLEELNPGGKQGKRDAKNIKIERHIRGRFARL